MSGYQCFLDLAPWSEDEVEDCNPTIQRTLLKARILVHTLRIAVAMNGVLSIIQIQSTQQKTLSMLKAPVLVIGHVSLGAHKPVYSLYEGSQALLSITFLLRA